jgi:hypothetical protein
MAGRVSSTTRQCEIFIGNVSVMRGHLVALLHSDYNLSTSKFVFRALFFRFHLPVTSTSRDADLYSSIRIPVLLRRSTLFQVLMGMVKKYFENCQRIWQCCSLSTNVRWHFEYNTNSDFFCTTPIVGFGVCEGIERLGDMGFSSPVCMASRTLKEDGVSPALQVSVPSAVLHRRSVGLSAFYKL